MHLKFYVYFYFNFFLNNAINEKNFHFINSVIIIYYFNPSNKTFKSFTFEKNFKNSYVYF